MGCMKQDVTTAERFEGCYFGLAVGDALGYLTEFLSFEEIKKKFGAHGIIDLLGNPALHSDDTQMSLALSAALLRTEGKSLDSFMKGLSEEFLIWFRSPQNDRAPGNTSTKACQKLEAGADWRDSGISSSKGCGANMRVAPIGLLYSRQPGPLRLMSRASAVITHRHPAALVAAEVTAFCVAWASQGVSPADYLDRIAALKRTSCESWHEALGGVWAVSHSDPRSYLEEGWRQLLLALDRVPQALEQKPADVCSVVGGGWVAEEALACALACVLDNPADFASIVRRGANSSGDSDSIASIAGAIAGAFLGVESIPKEWRKRIESRQQLLDCSHQLLELQHKILSE
jgi:ADP-ribosylglycohydrolase